MKTASQLAAVETVDQDILVSASAGAGKTTVLIDRLIKRILVDKVPVSRILALTFTEAAAAEMKHRLQSEMHRKLAEIRDPFLEEQLILLQTANISTIHSFCLTVVKNFGYVIDLNPKQVNNILDEATKVLYQKECLDLAFDEQMSATDTSQFINAAQHFSSRSEDFLEFRNAILRINNVLSQQKNPQSWTQQILALYDKRNKISELPEPVTRTFWEMMILHTQQLDLQSKTVLREAGLLNNEKSVLEASLICQWVNILFQAVGARDLDQYNHALLMMASHPLSTIKSQKDYNKLRDKLTKAIRAKANSLLSEAEYLQQLSNQQPLIKILLEISLDYNHRYNQKKKDMQCIDFDDMERFAFEILFNEQHQIYKQYQSQFDEIMVDEFQDTNQLQDAIISRVSKGNNIFRVGDVKQSIYKFRGAKPGLMRELSTKENIKQLTLEHNYRSKQPIVEFNNQLFNVLMNIEYFEDVYQQQDHVTPGKEGQFDDVFPIEIDILMLDDDEVRERVETEDDGDDEDTDETYKSEIIEESPNDKVVRSNFIANRMLQLHRKEKIAYRDMVVLVRSHALKEDLKAAFDEANIPYFIDSKSGFYQSAAISQVMNVYRWITQPANEIALLGILFSPFFNLSADQGAQLALLNRRKKNWIDSLEELFPDIHSTLHMLKEDFQYLSITESLSKIYALNRFYDDFCNHQEKTNLDLLFDKATGFDRNGIGGIYGFVSLIDKISDEKSSEAIPVNSEDDLVKVMTIHQSKGLQFKVVFYWSTNSNAIIDLTLPLIADEQLGLGLHTIQLPKRFKRVNLLRQIIEFKATKDELEEQIRVLYVALTRAQEKMIIVGSEKKPFTHKGVSMLTIFDKIGTQGWILNALQHLDESLYSLNRLPIDGIRTVRLTMSHPEEELPVYTKKNDQVSKMIPSLKDQSYVPQIFVSRDLKPQQQGTLMHMALQRLSSLPFTDIQMDQLNIGLSQTMKEHLIRYSEHPFTSELYRYDVSHEVPFMSKLDGRLIYGYIDMISEADDALIIIDFKTDRNVTKDLLIERHKSQMNIYLQAMKLLSKKKIEAYLYSFDLNEYIQV
jgi:ATP-dependent helicase/nuclease subunit A